MVNSSEPDSWWTLWDDRLQSELAAFEAVGATTNVLHDKAGVLILEVHWPIAGQDPLRLNVGFSYFHPFFRPEISAPGQTFARHQNPLTQGLCLVAQGPDQWDSTELVAVMIARQLKKLIAVNDARAAKQFEAAERDEEKFADPVSVYFDGMGEALSAAYYERDMPVPPDNSGPAKALALARNGSKTPAGHEAIEIVVQRLGRASGPWLAPDFKLPQQAGAWTPLTTRWARMSPLGCKSVGDLLKRAVEGGTGYPPLMGRALADWTATERGDVWLTILVVQDEANYSGDMMRPGFIVIVSRRNRRRVSHEVVRSFGIAEDIFDRLPIRAALRTKSVLLVGCGAIGSFVAMELARAGFRQIILMDPDNVEPGNYVRWPLGRPVWGLSKAMVLAMSIAQNFPWTTTKFHQSRLGGAESNPEVLTGMSANPFLDASKLVREVDLVVDATASPECQQALAFLAKKAGTPLVIGNSTAGGAGGMVAQFTGDTSGCFNCARQQWNERGLPHPPEDPAGTLVPVGCNAETFTGGSYDLQEVSLQMVRSSIGLLVPGEFAGADWDLAILSHFEGGRRILPTWQTASVEGVLPCCARAISQ